jgi:hypothetical protein
MDRVLADWSTADRVDLRRLLARLNADVAAHLDAPSPGDESDNGVPAPRTHAPRVESAGTDPAGLVGVRAGGPATQTSPGRTGGDAAAVPGTATPDGKSA